MATGIELLYGPMLIGVFFNCMLFGIMVMQAFIYFQTYKDDARWIRYFIVYLCITEVVNTAGDIYLIYQPVIQEFGSLAAVTYFPTFLAATPFTTVMISTPVQIFTAWRVGIIMQSWWMPALITVCSLTSLGGAFTVGIQVATFKLLATKTTFKFNLPGVIWFVFSAIADVLITATLVFSLSRRRSQGGSKRTNVSVNRIIRLTVQTGFVTMVFAMADLLFFTISPKTAISFVWDFSIGKLYTNALLSTLNARAGWSQLNTAVDSDNVLFGEQSSNNLRTGSSYPASSTQVSSFRAKARTADHSASSGYELESKPRLFTDISVTREVQTSFPGATDPQPNV